MKSKEAQGLSLNYIVIAIVAALVLIIIVAFTTTGLGAALSRIFQTSEQSTSSADVDISKAACKKLCSDAEMTVDAPEAWAAESYCERIFIFEGEPVHCWEAPVNIKCSASGTDIYKAFWVCDETKCERGCSEIKCSHCANETDSIDCPDEADYSSCIENSGDWSQ